MILVVICRLHTSTPQVGIDFLKNLANPSLFYFLVLVFSSKYHYNFLQQINVKNVHPVYSVGIRTHNLLTQVSSHNH